MKSILVIGMGHFGHHLCKKMLELQNEVMVVDNREDVLDDILPFATKVKIGDCTNEDVLKSLGVRNFDVCFVCIGTNFQSSLEITSLLKENGAKYVVSKATRDIQAKFLLRNGADEVIYPERDIAEKIAVRYSANHVTDFVELDDEFSVFEIKVADKWVGKSIRDVNFRVKYKVSILGYRREHKTHLMPLAEHIFQKDETLMVIGKTNDIEKIIKNL